MTSIKIPAFGLLVFLATSAVRAQDLPVPVSSGAHHDIPGDLRPRFAITTSAVGTQRGSSPVNDECTGAVVQALSVLDTTTLTGDNTGATDSEGIGYNTVWEAFTITECATVTIDLCGTDPLFSNYFTDITMGCPYDTVIAATSVGVCPDGNVQLVFTQLAAGTYYIPVLTETGAAEGPYTMTMTTASCTAAPSNDDCSGATPVVLSAGVPLLLTGDNTGATTAGDGVFGGSPTQWHAFTTTECLDVRIGYCGTAPVFQNFWTALAIDCPATTYLTPTTYDFLNCGNANMTMFFDDLPAGTYWIPVLRDALSVGSYQLNLDAIVCTQPPVNDDCASILPEPLSLNGSFSFNGDNANATTTNDAQPGTILDLNGQPVVWHAFTTTECMTVIVDYCGTAPAFTSWYGLLATTCPADDALIFASGFNDLTCGDGNVTVYFTDLAAGTYYIPVLMDPFEAIGPYTVGVSSDSCLTTSIAGMTADHWSVFPNPSEGAFSIQWAGSSGEFVLELLDPSGRRVLSERAALTQGAAHALITARCTAAGLYVLRISGPGGVSQQRVMIRGESR